MIAHNATLLPDDAVAAIKRYSENCASPLSRVFCDAMERDIAIARESRRPVCQDTGLAMFYFRVGADFPFLADIGECALGAVRRATREVPLRPNAVEVFTGKNSGDGTGAFVPSAEYEIVPGDSLTATVYLAGGGCSMAGASTVLMPAQGLSGVCDFVLQRICERGINACPPLVVGVGIAGCADVAGKLSKKALLRKLGEPSEDENAAVLERELTASVNALHFGPGGVGGGDTLLSLAVLCAARHPATLAVGVSAGCWAHRRMTAVIDAKLNAAVVTHEGVEL